MTLRVCLRPDAANIQHDNGIGRVVHAQYKYLPQHGIELVDSYADVYVGHTHQFGMPRVDVLCVHGLYWLGDKGSGEYSGYHIMANEAIIDAARKAYAITVPSQWVAMPFKRDMRISPTVIGHGIDLGTWQPQEHQGYILWNKNRVFDVCRPDAPHELAKRGLPIMSTYALDGQPKPATMEVTGRLESDAMRDVIARAGVYLSTTKETFGIGTLEAMACGVPVIGWNYGGTAEIVTSGVDGLLVKPGDYQALYDAAIYVMKHRDEMGEQARITARGYDWQTVIGRYAELFHEVDEQRRNERHGVSIVITNYNYGKYLLDAVDSALNQTVKPDEVIVVDDGSADGSPTIVMEKTGITLIEQSNKGVAAARSIGIQKATQPYIVCLDADDKLAPQFIETLLPVIDADRSLGIVYSGLTMFNETQASLSNYPPPFDWEKQAQDTNPPANCIPSACLFRRDMWLRAGPHKQEYAPGEDAEFWTRGLSIGYDARKVTDAGLFWYRLHGDSASRRLQYKPIGDRLPWLRDKRYPMAAPSKHAPLVMSYSEPKVTVIVTVNADNAHRLSDTIDSVLGQTMREWSMIVVNQNALTNLARYPFIDERVALGKNRAAAINEVLTDVAAPFVMCLDAGQMLTNSALEEMLTAFVNTGGRYIWSDKLVIHADNKTQLYPALPSAAALVPTVWAREIGFDVKLPAYVDTDYIDRLEIKGYCGQALHRPLLIEYERPKPELTAIQKRKIDAHFNALKGQTVSNCCGGRADELLAAKAALGGMMIDVIPEGANRLKYTGTNKGEITFTFNGHEYKGGDNDEYRYCTADEKDAQRLIGTGKWELVQTVIKAPVSLVGTVTPVVTESVNTATQPIAGIETVEITDEDKALNAVVATEVKKQRGRPRKV